MARARSLKPDIVLNDVLAALAHWVRLLSIYLWTLADKAGRLLDNPKRIGVSLFPYETALPFDEGLQLLHDAGIIQRYTVGELHLIQVLNWGKLQSPHMQENPSELPPMPLGTASGNLGCTPEPIHLTPDTDLGVLTPDRGVRTSEVRPSTTDNGDTARNPTSSVPLDKPRPEDKERLKRSFWGFITEYPKKADMNRAAASRVWNSLVDSGEITDTELPRIMAGLDAHKSSARWRNVIGGHIPLSDRFLQSKLWKKEPELADAEKRAIQQGMVAA